MTDLAGFKINVKRKLGYPVVNIELSTDQINLAVHEAITFYQRNHFNGSEKIYLPVQIDSTVKANRYVTVPDEVISIQGIFQVGYTGSSLLSTDFIMAADAMWAAFRSSGVVDYYVMMTYRSMIEDLIVGEIPVRYTQNKNRVYIDMSESKFEEGKWLMLEGYVALDPETDEKMFDDPWLVEYATAKVKQMWGQTMKKYQQVALPGGVMLDGQTMYTEASDVIEKMETEVTLKWQLPPEFMVG